MDSHKNTSAGKQLVRIHIKDLTDLYGFLSDGHTSKICTKAYSGCLRHFPEGSKKAAFSHPISGTGSGFFRHFPNFIILCSCSVNLRKLYSILEKPFCKKLPQPVIIILCDPCSSFCCHRACHDQLVSRHKPSVYLCLKRLQCFFSKFHNCRLNKG